MNLFQSERYEGSLGLAHQAIDIAKTEGFIALDAEGHCEAEWIECAGGTHPLALKDWIADMLTAQTIQLVRYKCDSMYAELNSLGVPKKDHKWVRVARSAAAPYIVTEDIDLFDPKKKKNCTSTAAMTIKLQGKGPVAKHLRKKFSIIVTCSEKLPSFF